MAKSPLTLCCILKTARVLLKLLGQFRTGATLPTGLKFLESIDQPVRARPSSTVQWLDTRTYEAVFEQRFLYLLRGLEKKVSSESSIAAGIQKHSMHCYKAANAYTYLVLVKNFASAVAGLSAASTEGAVLRQLLSLFALTQLDAKAGEFLESGCVSPADMPLLRDAIESLLPALRPHAVKLVDGFNFSDRSLNSVLGRYDGNVYEALYESAQLDPLNTRPATTNDAVALRELLLPIRDEIARAEGKQSRL
jgi:acyl-CoA oxidase